MALGCARLREGKLRQRGPRGERNGVMETLRCACAFISVEHGRFRIEVFGSRFGAVGRDESRVVPPSTRTASSGSRNLPASCASGALTAFACRAYQSARK